MDPWKHRTKHMICQCCMWYVPKVNDNGDTKLGRCRHHSPTMKGYPAVFPTDWCGDHKLDENKGGEDGQTVECQERKAPALSQVSRNRK